MSTAQMDTARTSTAQTHTRRRGAPAGLRELALVGVLYIGYCATRLAADDDAHGARAVASRIVQVEGWFGLDVEHTLATWTNAHRMVAVAASGFYAVAHYVATAAVLLYVWFRRRALYPSVRNVLVITTVAALVVYLLMPTAPPRFMTGYPDVLVDHASWGWWGGTSGPSSGGGITNELAAMPSMHVGWAVWVALTLQRCWRGSIARYAVWAYPVVTALVVIGTANHWVADAIAGAILVAMAALVVRRVGPVDTDVGARIGPASTEPGP